MPLEMYDKDRIYRRIAIGLALIVISLGVIFIALDILDIIETSQLNWSMPVINTVFISVIALITFIFATREFLGSGSFEMLGLGGAVLALGISILLYGWLPNTDLNTRITIYDSGAIITAAMHLAGAIFSASMRNRVQWKPGIKLSIILALFSGIIIIIGLIAWLGQQDIITGFSRRLSDNFEIRDITQGTAALFSLVSAFVYLVKYRASRDSVYFWYSLGLVLFAAGLMIILRGKLENLIAWIGRISLYVAGFYFLVAALYAKRERKMGKL